VPGARFGGEFSRLLCLEITSIDPVRTNLLFERFISIERGEAPDNAAGIAEKCVATKNSVSI
jgi:hypothetical protein